MSLTGLRKWAHKRAALAAIERLGASVTATAVYMAAHPGASKAVAESAASRFMGTVGLKADLDALAKENPAFSPREILRGVCEMATGRKQDETTGEWVKVKVDDAVRLRASAFLLERYHDADATDDGESAKLRELAKAERAAQRLEELLATVGASLSMVIGRLSQSPGREQDLEAEWGPILDEVAHAAGLKNRPPRAVLDVRGVVDDDDDGGEA